MVVLGSSTAEHDLDSVRSALGYLPQDAQWPGRLTVAQFMQLMCWLRKVDQTPTRIDRTLSDWPTSGDGGLASYPVVNTER